MPLAVGALLLLQLIQTPITVSLARRVARHEAERTALLERALSASERERRQIAADLHDGVVQDLAGAGYALAALQRRVEGPAAANADQVGRVVRGAVESLRRLMVDIYPPDLSGAGLPGAIDDLAEPLRAAGVTVTVRAEPLPGADSQVAATLYRVARETLANVAKHAQASTVEVDLHRDSSTGAPCVVLQVADDGVGIDESKLDRRAEGHLGLKLLIDRVADQGGELVTGWRARPGGGTVALAPACPARRRRRRAARARGRAGAPGRRGGGRRGRRGGPRAGRQHPDPSPSNRLPGPIPRDISVPDGAPPPNSGARGTPTCGCPRSAVPRRLSSTGQGWQPRPAAARPGPAPSDRATGAPR